MRLRTLRVLAVDRGGYNAIEPVLRMAVSRGNNVELVVGGICRKHYQDKILPLDPNITVCVVGSSEDTIRRFSRNADAVIMAASQSEEGTSMCLTALDHTDSQTPILAVEDMYGSLHPLLNQLEEKGVGDRITRMCVTDEPTQQLLLKRFPAFEGRVVVTGGPQYDSIPDLRIEWHTKRGMLRACWGVIDKKPIFLVVGGLNGTADILQTLEEAIAKTPAMQEGRIILRQHPRATESDKTLVARYVEKTTRILHDPALLKGVSSEAFLPGVDFVLSGYSTTNRFAIYCQMTGVMYMSNPAINADFQREKGMDVPLEVKAHAAWYIEAPEELCHACKTVWENRVPANMLRNQRKLAEPCDGAATHRVFQHLENIMGR